MMEKKMVEGRAAKTIPNLNDAGRVVRAIGESFFLTFFIVLIIYDTVDYIYGTGTTTMTNGHQHHSNRRDQPTTTTITDNLNDDDCGAGSSPSYVVFFFPY